MYARCSGLSRQSLWLGQIGPPPVCKSMSNEMSNFMSPIVDGKPQRIDTSVVSAHLQRRMYDAVNGSDLRKVREWLEVRGPVSCDNYQMAGRKIYMYALTKPHGSCRGSGGSDMHKQIKNQNKDIKHPTA